MASRTTTDPIEILLEMGIDLDNLSEEEDYLSALKEAIATILYKTKGKGNEQSRILTEEVVRVRKGRKAADPKFKAKKTKVSAAKLLGMGDITPKKTNIRKESLLALPPAVGGEDEFSEEKEKIKKKRKPKEKDLLGQIAKSVSNIVDILKKQYDLKKKSASYDRKQAEKEKRKLQESNLEKRFSGLKKIAEGVIAPVKSVLDRIFDFFLNILIGRFLIKFIDWFADPKNKDKVDSIIRFLVDFGPKLLGAYLLFGTRLGRFVTRLSFALIKGAARLGMAAAKFAIGFARRNPAAAAITAIVGGAAIGGIAQSLTPSNDPDAPEGRTQLEDTMDYGGVTGDPIAGAFKLGGLIPYFNEGGGISTGKITTNSGNDIRGAGPDTQLIAAQPGEIVINKKTVDAVGPEHFLGLNQQYGGPSANKPKTAKVQTASGGGIVLPTYSSGGLVGSGENRSGGNVTSAIPVSHPNTGSGFGISGVVDYKGRPAVFSKSAAEAFGKMIIDSGGQVKGSDIASSKRSTSYNAKVGGASRSNHLYGNALDIHGSSQTWMRANGRKYGWIVNDYPGSHGGHFNYKGAGASNMLTPDEGSPGAQQTGQGSRALGSTTQRREIRSSVPKSSIVLALKKGVQGKLNTLTGKFTPMAFTEAEKARYTQFGGTIPETKPKVKPKRGDFATGRGGAKAYQKALRRFKASTDASTDAITSNVSDELKRSDFAMGRSGAKAYTQARLSKTSPNVPSISPPAAGGDNVKVVRAPAPQTSQNPDKGSGSQADAAPTGNGNKAKWNILGIPMPF